MLAITPPYVESVFGKSLAADAGLQPDDLIMYVNGVLVRSCDDVMKQLLRIDRLEPVKLVILRDQQILDLDLPSVAQRENVLPAAVPPEDSNRDTP